MANIRILGLDDDNHAPCFVSEDGTHFSDSQALIEMLATPHQNTYEIKMFALVYGWSSELLTFNEQEVDDMFDYLEGISNKPADKDFTQIFNLFWESANRTFW